MDDDSFEDSFDSSSENDEPQPDIHVTSSLPSTSNEHTYPSQNPVVTILAAGDTFGNSGISSVVQTRVQSQTFPHDMDLSSLHQQMRSALSSLHVLLHHCLLVN